MSFFAILLSLFLLFHLPGLRGLRPLRTRRDRAAVAMACFFLGAGTLHFAMPATYLPMMPPLLPWPLFWVYLSGALEVGLGAAMLVPGWRPRAAVGLALLLLAVLPANVHVARAAVALEELPFPPVYFWLRIPFQAVFIAWALWAGGLLPAHGSRRGTARPSS